MNGAADLTVFYLMVLKGFTGEVYRVDVGPSDSVEQVLAQIADATGYATPDWERIGLYNLTQDFEYSPGSTLGAHGTRAGDLVVIADGAECHR